MNHSLHSFTNSRGQRLVGVLHGEPGATMAISCHGMLSNKDGTKHQLLATRLVEQGIPTFRFDFAGRGDSQGDASDLNYSSQQADLAAAVEYLVSLGCERLAVFGSSMGGAVALLAAARDERIVAVATLAAVGRPDAIEDRYPEACAAWRRQGYVDWDGVRIGRSFYDDALSHDVLAATAVLRASVLVMHGDQDEVVPVSDAHDIAAAARNVSLHIVYGADHRFSNPVHLRPTMDQVVQFFVGILLPPHVAAEEGRR